MLPNEDGLSTSLELLLDPNAKGLAVVIGLGALPPLPKVKAAVPALAIAVELGCPKLNPEAGLSPTLDPKRVLLLGTSLFCG